MNKTEKNDLFIVKWLEKLVKNYCTLKYFNL